MATNWGQRIRTGLGVTLVSVLVWLYAEAQAVVETFETFQVVFVPTAGQQLAIQPAPPLDPDAPQIRTRVRGSTRQLDQMRQLRESGPIEVEVAGRGEYGPRQEHLVARDALLRSRLGELGVNIIEADPATITLNIEPLTTETVPVRFDEGDLHLAGPARLEPAEIELTTPQRLADEAAMFPLTVSLGDHADLSQFEVDLEHRVNVPVTVPESLESPWTRVEPRTVEVTFTIREQTATIVKDRIGIDLRHSPVLLREYSFDVQDWDLNLLDVELTGPVDVLEQIQAGEIAVSAWVRPGFQLLEEQVGDEPTDIDLPVELDLPPDVSVTSALPTVRVTVTRRD